MPSAVPISHAPPPSSEEVRAFYSALNLSFAQPVTGLDQLITPIEYSRFIDLFNEALELKELGAFVRYDPTRYFRNHSDVWPIRTAGTHQLYVELGEQAFQLPFTITPLYEQNSAAQNCARLIAEHAARELTEPSAWRSAALTMKLSLRKDLDLDDFMSRRDELSNDGYRMVGIEVDDDIVSVATFVIAPHTIHRRELVMLDLATRKSVEGQGYAGAILAKLEEIGIEEGCGRIFVHTQSAKDYYTRQGFEVRSVGLIKVLG